MKKAAEDAFSHIAEVDFINSNTFNNIAEFSEQDRIPSSAKQAQYRLTYNLAKQADNPSFQAAVIIHELLHCDCIKKYTGSSYILGCNANFPSTADASRKDVINTIYDVLSESFISSYQPLEKALEDD